MPTYEFRCPDGTIIERIYKFSDVPSEIPAPDGSGMAVRVISGGAGLIFKGSGFYITDYGKDGKKDQRPPASASGEAKGESSGGGGESKPATPSDAGGGKTSSSSAASSDPAKVPAKGPPKPSTDS